MSLFTEPSYPAPSFNQWLNYKTKPTQFGDNKNRPGKSFEEVVAEVTNNPDEPATTPSEPTEGDLNG